MGKDVNKQARRASIGLRPWTSTGIKSLEEHNHVQGLDDNRLLLQGASLLAKPLAKAVMDGVTKPGQRADAVLALHAAVRMAAANANVDQLLEAENVWQELGKQGTPFLSAAATARLPAEEAACCALLLQELLLHVSLLPSLRPAWAELLLWKLLESPGILADGQATNVTIWTKGPWWIVAQLDGRKFL